MSLKEYLLEKKYIYLKGINYINSSESPGTQPELNCSDSISVRKEHMSIFVEIKRSVSFIPTCYFTADLSYEVELQIDPEKSSDFEMQGIDFETEIRENINEYVPDEMDRLSLLLAQITDSFEGRPLITVPQFHFEK